MKKIVNRILKRKQRKYNIPVIGFINKKEIHFNSILEAEDFTGISYHLIFDNCIDKIKSAKGNQFRFSNLEDYKKYKSFFIRPQNRYTRFINFNG